MKINTSLFFLFFLLFSISSHAQKFIAIDNYGQHRKKIYPGDYISFKMKGENTVYNDEVHAITDSSFVLSKFNVTIPLQEVSEIHFGRKIPQIVGGSFAFIGTGFLLSGAIRRDEENAYAKNVALVQGASFLVLSLVTIPFMTKRYKIGKNAQVQILDVSIKK